MPFSDCLHQVPCRRYLHSKLPLSCEVVKNRSTVFETQFLRGGGPTNFTVVCYRFVTVADFGFTARLAQVLHNSCSMISLTLHHVQHCANEATRVVKSLGFLLFYFTLCCRKLCHNNDSRVVEVLQDFLLFFFILICRKVGNSCTILVQWFYFILFYLLQMGQPL